MLEPLARLRTYVRLRWKRFLWALPIALWGFIEKLLEHRFLGKINEFFDKHPGYVTSVVLFLFLHPWLILVLLLSGILLHAYYAANRETETTAPAPDEARQNEAVVQTEPVSYGSPSYRSQDEIPEDIQCIFFLAKALEFCLQLKNVNYTPDERQRLLTLALRLSDHARALLPRNELVIYGHANRQWGSVNSRWIDLDALANKTLEHYFSEARYVYSDIDRYKERLYTDAFEEVFDQIYRQQRELSNFIEIVSRYRDGVAELKSSPLGWRLLGFATGEDFDEWVAPTMKSLFDSADPMEIELLRQLLKSKRGDITELRSQGFSALVVINTFNRLLRERWARSDDNSGRLILTDVGRRLLSVKLQGQRK